MYSPCFIFVIGCPASGKSTLAQMICQSLTMFEFATDLNALKEIFLINDLIAECLLYDKSPKEVDDVFSNIPASFFWTDILTTRIQQLKTRNINLDQLETIKTDDGGYIITKPYLWDEVLHRSTRAFDPNKCYVFEFSRGTDQMYMANLNITPKDIYLRSFSIIFERNQNIAKNNSLIIHTFANYNEREHRNRLRRSKGEHFVSQQAMEDVYKDDVFYFEENDRFMFPSGILSSELPVPVLSVDNTPQDPKNNFACVMDYLKLEVVL